MIYEKSCGAVVYKLENGRRLYLVERTPSGKTVLPKGHVEAGETEAETARREIWEETHLVVSLDTSFREIAKYSPKPESEKTVVFFLAQPVNCDARPQPEEVDRLEWSSRCTRATATRKVGSSASRVSRKELWAAIRRLTSPSLVPMSMVL